MSHLSGTDTVASMVVFTNWIAEKSAYRKFKMRLPGNDDFAHMNEVVVRRLRKKNIKSWRLPDLFLIDGGKGQLGAALAACQEAGVARPMIGLAKKHEDIIIHRTLSNVYINSEKLKELGGFIEYTDDFAKVSLPKNAHAVKLLQRIRDESHRFAVTYHSTLKVNRQSSSYLDTIPGVGAITKRTLLRSFGSLRAVSMANESDIAAVIGAKKAQVVVAYLHNEPKL